MTDYTNHHGNVRPVGVEATTSARIAHACIKSAVR
jgi:hypothetical protein